MGQRHQLFIVARVAQASGQPKTYRCVGAFHHQWCYGKLPLRCVNRFKNLARVKENAALIQRDLDLYHEGVQHSSDIPCPYISFLAGSAFTTDINLIRDERYFGRIHYEPADMGSMDGDNNDGITVIDVSTPASPSYCFVTFDGWEDYNAEPCVPLTAEQYLRGYYREVVDPLADDNKHERDMHLCNVIRDLDDMPVLTLDVLAATWPHEYKAKERGRTMVDPLVNSATESGSGPGSSSAESLPPYHDSLVDFSKQGLASTDLLRTLKDRAPFSRLDISHNKAVDKATVCQIMKEHRLEWLNIDGCNVSNADFADILSHHAPLFWGVEAVIHPAVLSLENLKGTSGIPNAFRFYYNDRRPWDDKSVSVSLPFFGVDQLVQNLTDIIEIYERDRGRPSINHLRSVLGACYREEGQAWATRAVQVIPLESKRGSSDLDEGYSFVLSPHRNPPDCRVSLISFEYGIVLPGGTKECVDIMRFFEHLRDEGWPKPKNEDAVKRLVGKFNEETGPGLVKKVGDIAEDRPSHEG